MCGVIGIFSNKAVAQELYDGLIHLQHRGQDAAGMLTCDERFHLRKGQGYVRDVFDQSHFDRLTGNWGIGHTRYPTAGCKVSAENAQPLMLFAPYGVSMVHNGDLTNYSELKKELEDNERCYFNSTSDLEVILHIFAKQMYGSSNGQSLFDRICEAVDNVYTRCFGGYAVVGIIAKKGMFAFRDPHGIRPLMLGVRKNENGKEEYIFSSENTMHYPLGFEMVRDLEPGEVAFIDKEGILHTKILRKELFTPSVFEYVYLARPDSVINNISVYRARLRMGQNLARKWMNKYPDIKPDIVVPVPFSSNTAALSMAHELGVRYSEGLYKNQFVGRTFIMPQQGARKKSILQKLSPQEIELRGKKVLLVDDSIVRGNTSKEVIDLVRHAGAAEVYFCSACPPIKFPDFYGIDIPTRAELIAATKSVEEIRNFIGADILLYQDIHDLVEAITRKGKHHIDRLSMPCLDGWYVTGNITKEKFIDLEMTKGNGHGLDFADANYTAPELPMSGDAKEESISGTFSYKNEKPRKILIIGSGAREHAIARALKRSNKKVDLFCFGSFNNPGILEISAGYTTGSLVDTDAITLYAREHDIDWAFIGPEAPLEAGVVDELRKVGIVCVGPNKSLARIETSKSFTRDLLKKYNIPGCPIYQYFESMNGVNEFLDVLDDHIVIKADGLAGGKGVKVFGEHLLNRQDTLNFCTELISKGESFLIEEKFVGQEFSLMAFCDGDHLAFTPVAQDHKRAFSGDKGPNTGGMGSYSDSNNSLPFLVEDDIEQAKNITRKVMVALKEECGEGFKGILYGGFMITDRGVKLIEYNARMADPETMNVLPILRSDFVELCEAVITGNLGQEHAQFLRKATVCKYLVPHGYPDNPMKNYKIRVQEIENKDQLYYAAVDQRDNGLFETGSRTICYVGIGDTISEAEIICEAEIRNVRGPLFHREDIGTRKLVESRVEMVEGLRKDKEGIRYKV